MSSAEATRESQWLADRMTGIGASDAAAVLGVSSWKTPYQLWAEKSGLIEADDISGNEWVKWGHRLEGVIAEAYEDESGRSVFRCRQYKIERHQEHEWMLCTPDAKQVDRDRGSGVLQIKTAGTFLAPKWEDEPPLSYQIQVQHELAVTGMEWGTLVVLIGGQRMLWFDIERNETFIGVLINAEREFWRRVTEQDPPPVDGSPATTAALKKLYPTDNGEAIALPPEAIAWDERLVEVKQSVKELEAEKDLIENRIKETLKDSIAGMLPDGTAYTYKSQTTNYKAKEARTSTFRVLRRRQAK